MLLRGGLRLMKNRTAIRLTLFVLTIGILISSWKYFNKKDSYYAYVANTGDGTISVIDTEMDEVIETIKVDDEISDGIAANPMNNEVYTANYRKGVLNIIDGINFNIKEKLELGRNIHGIDVSPDGKFLYVTSGDLQEGEEFNYIMIYDTKERKIVKEIKSNSKSPAHISFSEDSKFAFVSNVMSNDISVIDTEKQEIIRTIHVGNTPNEGKLSMDGKLLYVANLMDNVLSIVDIEKESEIERIPAGKGTHGVAVTDDDKYVWTANRFSNDVTIIDLESKVVVETITTGKVPNHVFRVPNSKKMYVSNLDSGDIAVVNTETYEITKKIKVGQKPHEIGFLQYKN